MPVEARVGVNTGEVVVRTIETGGHTEYTPIGHATNLASRMQTVAPAGSIAVSEATRNCARATSSFGRWGRRRSRGISEPVDVYEVVRARAAADAFQLAARRGLTKFVGRERELEQMQRALELAMERARADHRGGGGGRAPASRGCSTSSRRRCRPSARCSKPTRCRTARPRPGCRCSNCCAAISASRTPTMRPRGARRFVLRWRARPRAARHAAVSVRHCSASSRVPIRSPRWIRRSSVNGRSTRSSASSCAKA